MIVLIVRRIDTMIAGDHAVTYKTVETARLDTAAMKKDFDPDVLDELTLSTSCDMI